MNGLEALSVILIAIFLAAGLHMTAFTFAAIRYSLSGQEEIDRPLAQIRGLDRGQETRSYTGSHPSVRMKAAGKLLGR